MAELDFSKIFGETATSKASFTDENYLNGWGYLGSTPPPYQLFDYLQSLNDKKSKYLYDKVNENNNNLSIHNTNATAHTAILNAIKAISGTAAYDIAPSSTLSSLIPLVGFGGIVAQRLEANGYVKFASGVTIQWGSRTVIAGRSSTENFLIPITPLVILATIKNSVQNPNGINFPQIYTYPSNNASFLLTVDVISEGEIGRNIDCWWIALGAN